MKTFNEILEERKKKKQGATSFNNENTKKSFEEILGERNISQNDIGPVKSENREWFQKSSLFDDGHDFGDVIKTIIGSGTDVGENVATGGIGVGEKIVDAFAWISTLLGNQQLQANSDYELMFNAITGKETEGVTEKYRAWQDVAEKETDEFIKQDLYDEQAIAKKLITENMKKATGIDAETDSIFGEKSDELAQSAGQLGGNILANAIAPGSGLALTGITAFGGEMESALNQGASHEEAAFSAMVSAGAEMLTEKLTGGIKFGGKALDDALTSKITSRIANGVARKLVDVGLDAAGEGFEEILSGAMSAAGQKLSYMSDKEFTELFSLRDAWDSFVGGAVLGGFSGAGKNVKAKIQGVDSVTGLTKNEQAVFDKVYNDRLAEAKKDGKKLSGKDKENIYNDVMNAIEKGYIAIGDIESALGGETYKQYQSAVEKDNQMKELQKEYDTLYKMKNGEKSDEQIDRQKELKEQLDEYKNTSKLSAIQEQLSNEVSELAKTSKLSESYNEKSRKSQAFEADLSQYDEKTRETVKRAIDSGILNNTNRTHEFVDLVAKLSADKGVLFDFTNNEKIKASGFAVEGKQVNGYVQGNNIAINIDSTSALNKVVGHEITHILEGTELYTDLAKVAKELATTKGEYDSKLQSITKLYEGMENVNIENELTAELVGEYLFSDPEFVKRLSTEQPTLFKKIFDEVKYLCKVATAGSKEAKQLEKLKKTFEEAYRQKNNTAKDDGVRYSVAGVKSKTHDFSALEQAIRLEDVGKATSEEIRQQTGWYRGYDGEWRYEINDKDMKIKDVDITSGETKLGDVLEHQELFDAYPELKDVTISAFPSMFKPGTNGYYDKARNEISLADYFLVNTAVEKELDAIRNNPEYKSYIENLKNSTEIHNAKRLELAKEFKEIQKTSEYEAYIDNYFNMDSSENGQKVIEEWKNSDTGKRYEEIKAELSRMDKTNPKTDIENQFRESEIGKRYYELINNIDTSEITNNAETRKTLIHEIQHAIQHIEGFANGSNVMYWANAPAESKPGTLAYAESVRKKLGEKILSSASPEFVQAFREYNRGDIEYSDIENGNFTEEELDMLWDYDEADREVAYLLEHKGRTDEDLYYSTAGEIEARDASKRLDYTDEQRKNTRPDIDRTDVVFADDGKSYSVSNDYKQQVDDVLNGTFDKNNHVYMGNTPQRLASILGIQKLPMLVTNNHIYSMSVSKTRAKYEGRYNKNTNYHDLGDVVKQLPQLLNKPIMIIKSTTKSNNANFIVVTSAVDKNGSPVVVALKPNGKGNYYDVELDSNAILSAYGKENLMNYVNTARNEGRILYANKSSQQTNTTRVQFPNNVLSADYSNNLAHFKQIVNNIFMQEKGEYSLSNANDDIAPEFNNNNVYGEDIKLQQGDDELVIDDAPIKETQSAENVSSKDLVVDDMEFSVLEENETENVQKVKETIEPEAVTRLSSKVISTLGIGKSKANRNAVRELVKVLGDNYSDASKEDLYNAVAEKFGTQYIEKVNEEISNARSYIKELKINVPDSVKSEFGSNKDYRSFVKKNFGKMWISKDGAGIDQVYAELSELYPHLFPADKWNQADQLKQISDVVNKPKSDFIPFELDEETLREATDLIYDSVTEYREAVTKAEQVTEQIDSADISKKVKDQIKSELTIAYEKIEAEFNIEKKSLVSKLNERKSQLESDTVDKKTFFTNHASDLYSELKGLKKGIKASEDLAHFLDLGFNWNELKSTLLKVSKWPDTVLNSESEIEKTVRDFLDQRYEDSVQELNDFEWTMEDEISSLENQAEEKRENARLAVNGKLVREIMDSEQVALMGDTSLWKDKGKGYKYNTNTERRNFRDTVRDKNGKRNIKVADALYDYFMGTYNHNEAELKREAAKIQKDFADLKLNKYEDVFVQMKGEFLSNPHTELTQSDIDTFMKLHGEKIDEAKVDNAIDMARKTYDSLIERMNEVLVAHGMKPIEYRKGYFPHFTDVKKGRVAQFAENFFNWKTQNNDIPTDIAGLTESFKPNRSWQSFNKQRIADETDYSFMKGFDNYLSGSLDWIYHIDDIMKRRVFENRIRYDHSEEGVKTQIQEIYKNSQMDTNEKQDQIDLVFREAENPLNNFIIDFRTRTNTLAGKKSTMDRGMEEFTNRKFYSTMTNISNRVTSNMVVGSVSSALTNFIPITQSWGEVSPKSSLIAMAETIKSTFKDDGTINKSDFLTNRLSPVKKLHQTGWDKVSETAGFLMEAIDSFTSQTVWRSKYNENLSKGMSEAEAIKNADQFAENVIAGRSRGNMPTLFDSKNPLIKMATAFQLEVNNQYQYMFKDLPQDMKNESKLKLAKGYASMFVGAYAYNALYSSLTGRDAAFDPIGIIQEFLRDLFDDDEEETSENIKNAVLNLGDNVVDELPFVGGILGDGGRIPLSSALPYGDGLWNVFEGTVTDLTEGNIENLTKEWLSSAGAYLLSPVAGGQIKKTVQGLSMFDDDLPIAGSYTDSGKLRFSVDETMEEMVKAGLFGQYASKNARQYFDEERTPLSDKKTQELIDLDIPIADYWKIQDGLKSLGEDATLAEKIDFIADIEEFDTQQKNIMANNLTDRKEPINLAGYENIGDFEEFDYSVKNPGKYAVAKSVGGYDAYMKYSESLNNIKSEKDKNGNAISGSAKRKKVAYINSLDIEKGAKLILYKSQYKSDDTYNTQIVEYLKGRKDITRAEKETILTELGFTVHKDGRVTW